MFRSITLCDVVVNTQRAGARSRGVKNYRMETFGQRLRRLRLGAALTQEELANNCGYGGQSRIANYERSIRVPPLAQVSVLANGLGVSQQALLGLQADAEVDETWPDVLGHKVAASLGAGSIPDEYAETHKLKFRADSLRRKHLKPDNLGVVYGRGDSGLPRIHDGDAILFDRTDTAPLRDGKLYVVSYDGDLLAKKLVQLGGRWFIQSINPADPAFGKPQPVDAFKHFAVHGRVRWVGSWVE